MKDFTFKRLAPSKYLPTFERSKATVCGRAESSQTAEEIADKIFNMAAMSASKKQIAFALGSTERRLTTFLKKHDEDFDDIYRAGRQHGRREVEAALFHNAVENMHFPAQKYWLEQRISKKWKKDDQEAVNSGQTVIIQTDSSLDGV
jgi:hypothetical protein